MANSTAPIKTEEETLIKIPKMSREAIALNLVGSSSLIVHKFSVKAQRAIEEKQQKKAKAAKETRNPEAEYKASFYVMPDCNVEPGKKGCKYGFPAASFKNTAVGACRYVDGLTMTFVRGAFHVMEHAGGLIRLDVSEPQMRTDTVRIGMGTLDLRYRPEFVKWSVVLPIEYNSDAISPEQIANLYSIAGFSVGVGEWRPERKGSYGMFQIA